MLGWLPSDVVFTLAALDTNWEQQCTLGMHAVCCCLQSCASLNLAWGVPAISMPGTWLFSSLPIAQALGIGGQPTLDTDADQCTHVTLFGIVH